MLNFSMTLHICDFYYMCSFA